MCKTYKGNIIQRSKLHGVGKTMGHTIYAHRDYETDIVPSIILDEAKKHIGDFKYDIVRYNSLAQDVSFTSSPDWNNSPEPIVGDSILVKATGELRFTRQKQNPQIYHHKWLFVQDDYTGFDVQESINRSIEWCKHPVDSSRIGYKDYWMKISEEIFGY